MRAVNGKDLTQGPGRRRRSRPRRGPLAAALLGIALLCCLFVAAAPAGAAAADVPAEALLAQLALQQAELTAGDGAAGDYFGYAVALSGETALVGAVGHAVAGQAWAGAVYVFTRSAGAWTLQQMLTAADGVAGDWFGISVAISGDTALVGALLRHSGGQADAGAAYVFTRSDGVWTQRQTLTPADVAAGDHFGRSVALSGDTALVGSPTHDAAGQADAGAAYVFTRSGDTWSPQQTLVASDGAAEDYLGVSVALSGDTAVIGALDRDSAGKTDAGAAYLFTRSGGVWTQRQTLTAGDAATGDEFGLSVALSGGTALVGAKGHDIAGQSNAGAAYVFTRSGVAWTQQQRLSAVNGAAGDEFGFSVALSGDTALVGAPYRDVGGPVNVGAAFLFTRSGGSWTLQEMLTADDSAVGDLFGQSVALSGNTALVGAILRDSGGKADAGAAYVFVTVPAPTITKLSPSTGKRGAVVTITGKGFGKKSGASSVKFGATKCTKYLSWSATKITCKVPAKAKFGKLQVTLTTTAGKSNARSFTVKR